MGIHGSTESFDQTDGVMDGLLEGVSSNYKLVLNVMHHLLSRLMNFFIRHCTKYSIIWIRDYISFIRKNLIECIRFYVILLLGP